MCTNCNMPTLNQETADAFAEGLLEILNHGAVAVMISIGHRTGLFDAMAGLPASTSQEIADAAGLNERYVREWLGAMVTGRIVHYDPATQRYRLPAEHAAFLTRAAGSDNMATFSQYIAMSGEVQDDLITCFENGGGLPYSRFKRFHPVMAEDSGMTVVPAIVDHILPLDPALPGRLERGIDVADLGCGMGKALMEMAVTYPNSRFTGFDISEEAILAAQAEAAARGLKNVKFYIQDAAEWAATEAFDLICTFDAVHDQARPDVVLENIRRALRSDGTYLMQDIRAKTDVGGNLEHPAGPLLYMISCCHCMTVSLAAGGMGLGAMWGEEKTYEMLEDAGFQSIETHQLEHDFQNNFYIVRK